MKFLSATLIAFLSISLVNGLKCDNDSCLQALETASLVALPFCTQLLSTTTSSPTVAPDALSDCHNNLHKLSSACSCLLGQSSTDLLTSTSTRTTPTSSSSRQTSTSSRSSSTTPTATSTFGTTFSTSSRSTGSTSSVATSHSSSTSPSQSSACGASVISISTTTLTVIISPSTSATFPPATPSPSTVTITLTPSPISTPNSISISTTTTTATLTVTASCTPTANSATADSNGCPALNGAIAADTLYVYECNVNFGPNSFIIGTNPGISIEDCETQCFENVLGGDCLGVSYQPGATPAFGGFQAGVCTLYSFPDVRVPAPGMAIAVFKGL